MVAMIFLADGRFLNFNGVGSSTVFHIMEAFFVLGVQEFVEENLHFGSVTIEKFETCPLCETPDSQE